MTVGRSSVCTFQEVLFKNGAVAYTGSATLASIVHTPATVFSSDLVNLEGVGPNFNGSVLNIKTNDAGSSFLTMDNGTTDIFSWTQAGVMTFGEGTYRTGSATGIDPSDALHDFRGDVNQSGVGGYDFARMTWTTPSVGTGVKRGLVIDAPAGFVGDGLWFGVAGAEKFAVDQGGDVDAHSLTFPGGGYISFPSVEGKLYFGAYGVVNNSYIDTDHTARNQLIWRLGSDQGRQLIFADRSVAAYVDFDHAISSTPITYWQSAIGPNISNQEWGSATHDGGDFVLSAGPTGAGAYGTGSTSIRNAVRIDAELAVAEVMSRAIQTTTLAAAATTLALTRDIVTLTGDGLGNTLATITGGITGQVLRILCVDGLVTITDDATGNADTVNLSAAFTGTADDILTLLHNGTSWREVSRSVN